MHVKAVIFRPDRKMKIRVLKERHLTAKRFRENNFVYEIDPDRVIIDERRRARILWKEHFATYFYIEGIAKPLPLPTMQGQQDGERCNVCDHPGVKFPDVIDNGIPSEELAAIMNPWFFRVIAKQEIPWYKDIQFMTILGIGVVLAYLTWQFMEFRAEFADYEAALRALRALVSARTNTPSELPPA